MRHILTILGHEVRMLLVSPSTYIAGVLFLSVMGFVFASILDNFSKSPQETSPAYVFFNCFFVAIVIVPLLTMKCLAEERRLGTIETLLTSPVNTTEVVLGKYGAAYLLYLSLWASTAGFFYILYRFAGDTRLLDAGPIIGGYCFIAVSGLLFVAIGVFASSLSRNQAVAGLTGFFFLAALIVGFHYLGEAPFFQNEALHPLHAAVDSMQVFDHFADFSRGIVDTRQILFYLSGTALTLIFSILSVEAKLLHS
ncbi:MAG: ABC transporter permease [Opitutaceae bacterium]|jgi:ABC-2 type transport system permease protein